MSDPSGITPDEAKEQKPTINLKVKINNDGSEVFFRIKPTAKLNKVIDALCTKRSLDRNSLVLSFDGDHINGKKTAAEHHMEDGDEIDVFLPTDGRFGDIQKLLKPLCNRGRRSWLKCKTLCYDQ